MLPDEKRVSVEWAQISMVTATINLVEEAHRHGKYDYYWLTSGQDWPLYSADEIVNFFKNHDGENFIQYWDSKNYGNHLQNNLDKRNQIYFPPVDDWEKAVAEGRKKRLGRANRRI